jgi:hypothetical protein
MEDVMRKAMTVSIILALVTGFGCNGTEDADEASTAPIVRTNDLAPADAYDDVVDGLQVQIVYDTDLQAFTGLAVNTSDIVICGVEIEVEIMVGAEFVEVGETTEQDLGPGEEIAFEWPADGSSFESWAVEIETCDTDDDDGGEHEDADTDD